MCDFSALCSEIVRKYLQANYVIRYNFLLEKKVSSTWNECYRGNEAPAHIGNPEWGWGWRGECLEHPLNKLEMATMYAVGGRMI